MEVSVRSATVDDFAVIADLIAAAVAEQIDARGGALLHATTRRQGSAADRAAAALGDQHTSVIVGEIDACPVGYCVVHWRALADSSVLAVIEDLFVVPEAREVGVGEALACDVLAGARERGCRGIDAHVLPGNRATKNFFEMLGLTAREITVHRNL